MSAPVPSFPRTADVNVEATEPLVAPADLIADVAPSDRAIATVVSGREQVRAVLSGEDKRLLCVVGPCSIHDKTLALEYAAKLKAVAEKVADRMLLVMRVYFEKPRTTVGWKGLINDPHLNDTFDITTGLRLAREVLLEIAELGLPAATEMLEPITPQYIADLITLASIGARTTESPTHRQMASGLSMPVGYKNGTDGSITVATNAMLAAQAPHRFLGIDAAGKTCVIRTKGNPWGHLILRGGHDGPNYDEASVANAAAELEKQDLPPRFLVDCSHANSNKDYTRQPEVFDAVLNQRLAGNEALIGMMLESNLAAGNQKIPADLTQLKRGVSLTDGCLGWEETERVLLGAWERLT
ncbi:MAG: 3-deoxy-7-phosphoheptulonate synthase [Planctomycetota bacterium]